MWPLVYMVVWRPKIQGQNWQVMNRRSVLYGTTARTAIVGTLEIEEFIGNGVGPNVYAVGSLKGDLRISFKNCLHSRQFHKQTIKHATTQSIW